LFTPTVKTKKPFDPKLYCLQSKYESLLDLNLTLKQKAIKLRKLMKSDQIEFSEFCTEEQKLDQKFDWIDEQLIYLNYKIKNHNNRSITL